MYDPIGLRMQDIAVIPCRYMQKVPAVDWKPYQDKLPDLALVFRWFGNGTRNNAAVVTGWQGLTILDFDTLDAYHSWVKWAQDKNPEIARDTYRVLSSRGMHVYLFVADRPGTSKLYGPNKPIDRDTGKPPAPDLWGDIKGTGSIVIIPPSIHPSGTPYYPLNPEAEIMKIESLRDIIPNPYYQPPPRYQTRKPQPYMTDPAAPHNNWPMTPTERIRASVNILDLFPDASPSGGDWYMATCPWHNDHKKSLWVNPVLGICKCHVGCTGGKAINVVAAYAKKERITYQAAIKALSRQIGGSP